MNDEYDIFSFILVSIGVVVIFCMLGLMDKEDLKNYRR